MLSNSWNLFKNRNQWHFNAIDTTNLRKKILLYWFVWVFLIKAMWTKIKSNPHKKGVNGAVIIFFLNGKFQTNFMMDAHFLIYGTSFRHALSPSYFYCSSDLYIFYLFTELTNGNFFFFINFLHSFVSLPVACCAKWTFSSVH